ncbi:hypothetical protein [Methylobacterium sp. R2-1]|uniref:hypothetical protein n=1 Tax=Methylobacterium sp. R2-1 TaxID=2587064 RepID=UPI001613FACA|nr:hypothetical protein [Methylobacterium sp. R2-1]MBB2964071.1 hypothetical protein [Methylobacterium sp. R2-1]
MALADGTVPPEIGDAPKGQDAGTTAAALRGALNGIPVVGPAIVSGAERAAAGIGAMRNETSYADTLEQVQANSKATAEAHPHVTTGSEIAGAVLGTAPLVAAAPAAFGISAASLPVRAATSMVTNGALGAADGRPGAVGIWRQPRRGQASVPSAASLPPCSAPPPARSRPQSRRESSRLLRSPPSMN